MVGQLFGLHTLSQILHASGVRSNKWSKVLQQVTTRQLEIAGNALFLGLLERTVGELARKSDSTWSRAEPTIVVDDSIFKQWLSKEPLGIFFAKYFSGQTKSGVYGFRVTLCGMSLDGTFFPSGLCLTAKSDDTVQVACRLVGDLHTVLCRIKAENGQGLPNLFLSADNGFEGPELLQKCEELSQKLPIWPICVPKKTQKIQIGDCEMSISEAVEAGFVLQEKQYLEDCARKDEAPQAFTLRRRAFLPSRQREVVLLFFRLGGSGKVSVVYTPDLNIKAKTLRRRWFQRTQIEQFFRLLKDTLKIQQTKNKDKEGFERKLFIFVFQALQCQLFRNYCRQKFRQLKGWAFSKIRQRITFEGIEKDWLTSLLAEP